MSILVLVVAIVLTFLVRAAIEQTSSASYHASVSARQLADTAVSVVQTQINRAVTQGLRWRGCRNPEWCEPHDQAGLMLRAY